MAKSVINTGAEAIASVFTMVTGTASMIGKNVMALDRASDASYGHADTFVRNSEMRNQGSLKDTMLDEEERDHERLARRIKFLKKRKKFIEDFPEAAELLRATEPEPETAKATKKATARK